jgi:HEAT repeat protein
VSHGLVDALTLLELRPKLKELPLRPGDSCMLTARNAATLETLSRKLRVYLDQGAPINKEGERPKLPELRAVLGSELRGRKPEWLRPEAIPTLFQMLCHEDKPVRLMLIEMLDAIPGKASTVALAKRAVFDLDPEVREAAVTALRQRPLSVSRRVLVDLVRYPWAPAAEHAAEALVNLPDRGAVGQLIAALNESDPAAPMRRGNNWVVPELVRIHHLTNCILCHPPATTASDPVLGADPVLTVRSSNAQLAAATARLLATPGSHSYGAGAQSPALLRGDVTYLRQDFSVLQALPPALATALQGRSGPLGAPAQRFDFVVRRRQISQRELNQLRTKTGDRDDFPQRTAILFALRELTGEDAGRTYADWLRKVPDAADEAEAARLSVALIQARGDRRDALLKQYGSEKGLVYTLALAAAIPGIEGKFQDRVREALEQRLTRMTVSTLRERLREEDRELRRAAAAALAGKRDESAVPDLVTLLDDKDPDVAEAAGSGLRLVTGKSFTDAKEWREWLRAEGAALRAK